MGGGKGGGGSTIPEFVKESQKMTGERSKRLYDLTSPVMKEGVGQIQSLLTTGGPGAQVPIIANIEEGSRRAFNVANRQIEEQMSRGAGGLPRDPSLNRISEMQGRDFEAGLKSIAPSFAAPLISTGMGAALGGPGLASAGYQSGAQALSAGVRRPPQQQSGASGMGQLFQTLGSAYASGALGGGGKGGGMGTYGVSGWNSGMAPSGNLIMGNSGMLGGGV